MARRAYISKSFYGRSRKLIAIAKEVLEEFNSQGYVVTLRQLYYQLVKANHIPNNKNSYDRLGNLIGDARMAGIIDWDYIEDRGRNLHRMTDWENPQTIINAVKNSYHLSRWKSQQYAPEVWIEKEALFGVFERICNKYDVPLLACKGYLSLSEMHSAALRFGVAVREGRTPIVIHFGDHDSSGIDMTRDNRERLSLFLGREVEVNRAALNMNQIEEHDLPPQFAKTTDPRASNYIEIYGDSSWELDALTPSQLDSLVSKHIEELIDNREWEKIDEREAREKQALGKTALNWQVVESFVKALPNS